MGHSMGKYRGILASIALFLLLDASVLMLNFYMSYQIADDAVGVNLAGRQRMLSQRMVKSLFELEHNLDVGAAIDAPRTELAQTVTLFDQTLTAFSQGGASTGASDEEVILQAVNAEAAQAALDEALIVWHPYRVRIEAVLAGLERETFDIRPALATAIAYARENNVALLTLMNDLTVELEQVAASKATRLRLIQTIGISLALINFLIILFHFLRQLRDSDRKIEAARQETTEILDTVQEGLFLLDRDLVIGNQHSKHLAEILGRTELAGQRFDAILTSLIGEADQDTATKFIGLLFEGRIKEKLVGDLNPLSEIRVFLPREKGLTESRYLSFNFSRVKVEGDLHHLLVTVRDITDRIRLAQELEASKARGEEQLGMLTGILHVNPALLESFITGTFETFNKVNQLLEQPAKDTRGLRAKIDNLFIEVHRFKGEAAALNLEIFEREAQAFEQEIAGLRQQDKLVGNDFLKLTVRLDRLIGYTHSIQQLAGKLATFGKVASHASVPVLPKSWQHLEDLAKKVASRQGKNVMLVTSGLTEQELPDDSRRLVSDLCIQFIRNAIAHGIETPDTRLESQKPETGRIDVRLVRLNDGKLELTVTDDGQGFDLDAIRERALASERWHPQEVEGWDSKRLTSLIFEPGFSTKNEADEDAGQGVGMDVVMRQVQSSRGRIRLSSRRGRYCRFEVTLPAPVASRVAA